MCNREVHTRIFEVDLVYFEHLLLIKPKTVSNTDCARHLGVILFFFQENGMVVMGLSE